MKTSPDVCPATAVIICHGSAELAPRGLIEFRMRKSYYCIDCSSAFTKRQIVEHLRLAETTRRDAS